MSNLRNRRAVWLVNSLVNSQWNIICGNTLCTSIQTLIYVLPKLSGQQNIGVDEAESRDRTPARWGFIMVTRSARSRSSPTITAGLTATFKTSSGTHTALLLLFSLPALTSLQRWRHPSITTANRKWLRDHLTVKFRLHWSDTLHKIKTIIYQIISSWWIQDITLLFLLFNYEELSYKEKLNLKSQYPHIKIFN